MNVRWGVIVIQVVGVGLLAMVQICATLLAAGRHVSYVSWVLVVALVAIASVLTGVPSWQWWKHERGEKLLRFTNRLLAGVVVDSNRDQVTGIPDLQSVVRVYNMAMGVRVKQSFPGLRHALDDVLARLESLDWDSLGISLAVPEEAIQHARGTINGFLKEIDSASERT